MTGNLSNSCMGFIFILYYFIGLSELSALNDFGLLSVCLS